MFLENLLLNKNHLLQNRTLHISNAFKNDLKANIDREKANIEDLKSNIESYLPQKQQLIFLSFESLLTIIQSLADLRSRKFSD